MEFCLTQRIIAVGFYWLVFLWMTAYLIVYMKFDPAHKARIREDCDDEIEAEAVASRPNWMVRFYSIWTPVAYALISVGLIIGLTSGR